MQIRQTKLSSPQKYRATAPTANSPKSAPANDSFSFSALHKDDIRDMVTFTTIGAVGGAIGGHLGGNGFLSTALLTTASTAATDTIAAIGYQVAEPNPMGAEGIIAAPIVGGALGLAGGVVSAGLTAVTGLNPVIAGALGGGLTHLTLAAMQTQG